MRSPRGPIAVDAALHLLEGRRLVALGRVLAAHREDAPDFLAERKHRDGAAVVPPQIDAAMIEVAAVDLHIGEQEGLRLGVALEGDLQRLAHGAAGAVAAGQVLRPDGLVVALGMAQRGCDAGRILRQSDQFDVALDRHAQFGQPLGQQRLGARLGQQQRKGKRAVDAFADGQRRQPAVALADAQRIEALTLGHELVDHAHALQRFQAGAPQRQRLGDRAGLCRPVDDAHRYAPAAQGDGQRQAGRPGANDQDLGSILYTHRSSPQILSACDGCGLSDRSSASMRPICM